MTQDQIGNKFSVTNSRVPRVIAYILRNMDLLNSKSPSSEYETELLRHKLLTTDYGYIDPVQRYLREEVNVLYK